MTDQPEPIDQALAEHDITLALTPGQLILLVVGVYVILRFLRGLRG
jgi:hypothetical protein